MLPLPRRLWPLVKATEEAFGESQTRVSVTVAAPLIGHLISYEGTLTRENDA